MSFTASGITPSRQTNDHFDAIVSRRALMLLIYLFGFLVLVNLAFGILQVIYYALAAIVS